MQSIVQITPVSIWTNSGIKTGTKFKVRYVNYNNGPAKADCQILDADDNEVAAQLVDATQEQTALWDGSDDIPFYKVLAQNAGLSPTT